MPEESEQSSNIAPIPIVTYQLPRNPCIFSGDDQQEASRWLKDFKRIATYNQWDEQMCMANVIFYLAGTARQWFDNNEDTLSNWTVFQNSLKSTFGQTDDVKRQAERLLLTRVQQTGETTEAYIQDVLSLCRKVNSCMPDSEKVAHLMKGIAEDMYQILLVQDYLTVDAFTKRCRQIESLRRTRINQPRFQRLPNIATVSSEVNGNDIRSMIRTIVREELQKIFPESKSYRTDEPEPATDIAAIVQEEMMDVLAPITRSKARYNNPRKSSSYQPRHRVENNTVPQRKTDMWRTETNVPICYHCGRPGHVLRYCRERRQVFNAARNSRMINTRRDIDNDSIYSLEENQAQSTSNFRSSSPYPRRQFSRRQSQSPARRSSRSPRRVDEEN